MANVEIQQPNADAHDFSDAYHFDARTDERPPRDVKRIVVVGTVVPDFIFKGFTKLTHVHLPESVEHIGWSAFEECRSLKTITLPRSLRQIEGHAFLRSGLESVSIPDRCSIIGCHVFAYCEQLKSISFPKNDALDIEMACCQGCSSLVACDLGSGMKQLNNSFFEKCCSLEEIHLPSSIVRIGCDSFEDASALKEIYLHDNIVHISDGSFSGCKNLRKVRLPNNANTFIGNNAFKNCSSLLQIVRPERCLNHDGCMWSIPQTQSTAKHLDFLASPTSANENSTVSFLYYLLLLHEHQAAKKTQRLLICSALLHLTSSEAMWKSFSWPSECDDLVAAAENARTCMLRDSSFRDVALIHCVSAGYLPQLKLHIWGMGLYNKN